MYLRKTSYLLSKPFGRHHKICCGEMYKLFNEYIPLNIANVSISTFKKSIIIGDWTCA